jgi:alpha-L-fucosidase
VRLTRRTFLSHAAAALAATRLAGAERPPVPDYLRGHEAEYRVDPRAAALSWFRAAKLGLFVHYNNCSLVPGGKLDPLPAGVTFEQLSEQFRAEHFDAQELVALAVDAGARYLCFTPFHGGGPYLWRTGWGRPSSVDLPARRDLVAEMAAACHRRGLGYFHYVHVSLAQSHDEVWEANRGMLLELATRYGPIAGWWFDTSSRFREQPQLYPRIRELFAELRAAQPASLISFCEGPTGEEDYLTFEHRFRQLEGMKRVPAELLARHRGKPVEICTTLQLDRPGGQGTRMWFNVDRAYHRNGDEVWTELRHARSHGANFLLNTGPRADGSVHPADRATLLGLGERLRREGFPEG